MSQRTCIVGITLLVLAAAILGCGLKGQKSSSSIDTGVFVLQDATKPDLRIDNPTQMTGQTGGVVLHFDVVNAGTPATNVAWRAVRQASGSGSDLVVGSGVIPSLDRGGSSTLTVTDAGGTDEMQYLITADPDNTIDEMNENNNSVGITAVGGGSGGPPTSQIDLRFDNAHYHGMYYYTDPIFHFWVQNVNTAGITAQNVKYLIRVDGGDLISGTIASIPANQEVQVFTHTPSVSVGHHSFTVLLDPDNAIPESDEGNNLYRCEVDVRLLKGPYAPEANVNWNFQDPHFHGPTGTKHHLIFHWFLRNHCTLTAASGVDWELRREGVVVASGTAGAGLGPDAIKEILTPVDDPAASGEVHYRLVIDPANAIDETQPGAGDPAIGEEDNNADFIVLIDPFTPG